MDRTTRRIEQHNTWAGSLVQNVQLWRTRIIQSFSYGSPTIQPVGNLGTHDPKRFTIHLCDSYTFG